MSFTRFHPKSGARPARLASVVLGIVLSGCGGEDPAKVSFPTDPGGRYFEIDHVLRVALEMAPADYETLRFQTRNWWDVAAGANGRCLAQPFNSPFTDFEANATIDGRRFERVLISKKGFLGSVSTDKPSFRIKLDKHVQDQTLNGLQWVILNGTTQDPSYVKQCVGYKVFGDAGLPAPRCNFARVTMNGRDLGLYVHVEALDKTFLRRTFEDENGNLWKGTLSDFRPEWATSFELKTNEAEVDSQTVADRSRLDEVARAVDQPDATLEKVLDPLIDIDEFLTFWATEVILEHWDGYANAANNFYVYDEPTGGRFVFMPWDTDQIFMPDPFAETLPPPSVFANGILAWRLYRHPALRERYRTRMRLLLDTAFKEDELIQFIDHMEGVIRPELAEREGELGPALDAIEVVRTYIRGRRAVLTEDLGRPAYVWNREPRASPCVERAGEAQATFATTWGTNGRDAFAWGQGTLSVLYRGQQLRFRRIGATAGPDQNDPTNTWPTINMTAEGADGMWYGLWLLVRPDLFHDGASGTLEWADATGGMGVWDPYRNEWRFMGSFVTGPVRLERASTADGAPVRGSFETWLIQWN